MPGWAVSVRIVFFSVSLPINSSELSVRVEKSGCYDRVRINSLWLQSMNGDSYEALLCNGERGSLVCILV